MISNFNKKGQPYELYKPPHLRKGCDHTEFPLNSDTSKSMDDYLEVKIILFLILQEWSLYCVRVKCLNAYNIYELENVDMLT